MTTDATKTAEDIGPKAAAVIAFRLDRDLIERLDEAARRESKPGVEFNRTQMVRILLEEGLERRKLGKPGARRRGR
jgi:hypothetical protein